MKRNDPEQAYERSYENYAASILVQDSLSTSKPHCPPLLSCALGLWITEAVLLTCGQLWDRGLWLCVSFFGFALLLPFVILTLIKFRHSILFFLIGSSLALGLSGTCVVTRTQAAEAYYDTTTQALVTVTKDASAGLYGQNADVSITLPSGDILAAQGRFPSNADTIRYGDTFRANVSLSKPHGTSADFAWQSGCFLTAKIADFNPCEEANSSQSYILQFRNSILETLSTIPGDASALIGALACGYRKNLSEEAYQSFKVCGLAHVIAVSGAHLSLVCAFIGCLLQRLPLSKRLSIILQLAFILAYLVLAGMPISALRAAVMTALSLCSFFAKRRPYALNALALCIVCFIACDPFTALSISFALSAGSTLGILLFSSLFGLWLLRFCPKLPRVFRDALALTFASNIITLPLSAAWFSQISLIAPLANAITSPFFAPLCTLSLLGALLILALPAVTPFVLSPLCVFTRCFLALIDTIAAIPYAAVPATIPLGVGLLCALVCTTVLWHMWPTPPHTSLTPRPRTPKRFLLPTAGALACLLLLFALIRPQTPACELRMLDVGQGDAILLRSQGASLLVDTGNQDAKLLQALARASIAHLDAILITHSDDDHMGSLDALRGVVTVDTLLVAADALRCPCDNCARLINEATSLVGASNITGLHLGDKLQCGAFDLHVIWPRSFQDEGGNADSLCLLAQPDINNDGVEDYAILLTGDAEYEQINTLLDNNLVGDIDVYKVGHHGSKNALDDRSAALLDPEVALISSGAHNRYGHPAPATIDRLESVGAHILRTDLSGDVSCEFSLDGIQMSTQR